MRRRGAIPVTTLDENTSTRTRVADIAVTDDDDGPRLLELVGDDAVLFELNGAQTQLFLKAGQVLDFESGNTRLDVTVQVMGSPAVNAPLSITLNDVPEAPTSVTLRNQVTTLDENTVARTRVADIEVVDVDGGSRMLELVGDDAGLFELNANQDMLFLRAGQVLDFESGNTRLDVTVRVMGSPAVNAPLSITLNDVDDAPTEVRLINQVATLDENTVARTRVADIAVTDADGGPRRLELVGDDAVLFELNGAQTQLFLKAGQVLDFESGNNQLDVTVQVMGSSPAVNADLSITLNDVDEAPTAVTLSNQVTTLDENTSVRTKVADIEVVDVDGGARRLELVGDDAVLFELSGAQTQLFLKAGQVLDFEGANTRLDVTVRVMGSPAVNAPLSITLNDVPEAPTSVTLRNQVTTLDENTVARTRVADIEVVDVDGGSRMLELVGDDAGLFELNATQDMLFLRAGQVLDFEGANNRLDVTVRVMGSPGVNDSLRITLNDVDDAPTGVTLRNQVATLDENTVARTRVADIEVVDADDGPRLLELVGDDAGLFELNGAQTQLLLRAGQVLDFESANNQLDVTVRVIGSSPAVSADLSITLNDLDEPPTAVTLIRPVTSLDENTSVRTKVADIAVVDADGGSRMLELVGEDAGLFELSSTQTQLFLRAGQVLDFESANNQLDVTVRVIGSSPAVNAPLRITLNDVDEPPTAVTLSNQVTTLDENTSVRTRVADIAVVDTDGGSRMLELVGEDAVLFELNGDQTQLFLRAGQVLDFESANKQLDVTVRVMGSPGVNAPLRIMVNDVNEAPTTGGDAEFTVVEGASYVLTVADLTATDVDAGDGTADLIWTFMSGGQPTNGQLVLIDAPGTAIDTFTQAQLEAGEVAYVHGGSNAVSDGFTLRVADDGGLPAADPVVVSVEVTRRLDFIDLGALSVADGFIIQGDATNNDEAGGSVSAAGDVNGDGFADLIVGANYGDRGGTHAGEAYVVFGKQDDFGNLDSTNRRVVDLTNLGAGDGFIIQGDAPNDRAGRSVSGAGDVNGDGFADLIVGAFTGDDGGDRAGEAYVVFGKEGGFGSLRGSRRVVDLESLAPEAGFIIQGDAERDYAGGSVSGAGDVNGDGFADLIVGATGGDDGGDRAGEAYVVFGKVDGFGSLDPDTNRRVVDLTSLAPAAGFIIQGDAERDFAGRSVSGAGDVNGDGYADLIVGARGGDDGGDFAGEAYVVFGKEGGFGSLDTDTNRRVVDLTGLAPDDGFIIQGDMANDQAGGSVSGAGDVNGDGFADLIVGATFGDDGGDRAGEAYVVFGKEGGFGSLDTETNRRVVDLTELAPADGFIIQGDAERDYAGISVSGAGDVNGDGYADLLVGAPIGDDGGTDAGEAYVVFGKQGGFGSLDTDTNRRVVDLTGLAPADGFIIQGDRAGDEAGVSVSGAGDVNGDGFADLIVGAYRGDDGGTDAGEAYVLFGGPAGLSTEAAAVLGTDGDDDLNADGQATVVLAGAGDDVLNIDGFGETDLLSFDGGTGTDTLRLNGAGLSLDLSTLPDTRLSSIERIDLSGSGANSLSLTRLDLLNLSEVRTQGIDGTEASRAELRVDGNAGDRVNIIGDWMEQPGREEIDGNMYRTFDNGNARLLVNTAVDVNVAPTTDGDGRFRVLEGTSYTLTTNDLSARDPDDDAVALTWTVTTAPTNGRLALSDALGTAISDFTQAQLEAGEVVYVPTAGGSSDDSFEVRVADDQGARAAPVTVNIAITSLLGNIDLSELTVADGFIIQGDVAGDSAGGSVSGAGDVNGDGFADLIVGAYRGDDGGTSAGEAYVVFGSPGGTNPRVVDLTSLPPGDGFIIQGDVGNDLAGISVSGAGDVNGDGFADLIVGARFGDDGGTFAGEAYVVFGSPGGTNPRVVDLTNLAAGDGFIIQGDAVGDNAGYSVSGAGDVNGDGFADLIVGARHGRDGGFRAGEAYVVFGKASDFGNLDSTDRRVVDLTELAPEDGFIIQGDANLNYAGRSVSGAGDVNGDGFADLIVGAPGGGEAYVVFGKASDFGNLDSTDRRVVDLTELAPEDGFIIQGDAFDDRAGSSVSGAGDVNGDGYADLIVGAFEGDDGGFRAGEAYVVFGKASDSGNPMSGRQVIDLTNLAAGDGFIIQGDVAGDYAGVSVSGAGDVNGDGFADLIVGAFRGDDGGTDAGEAYVVFGKASGFGSLDPDTNRRVVDLTGLAPEDGFIIQGDVERDYAGRSVSGAGDVNGDGYADLIVGANRGDDGGTDAGEAYVLFGGPAGLSTEAAAVLGTDGDDDLNADGQATVVLAGTGDDVLNIDGFGDTDLLRFDGGSGTDTLRLNGAGLSLDLSTLADTRLSSIERIDLSGSGANSLTLTRQDLLNLSEVRTRGTQGTDASRAELRVDGNAGDRVTLFGDWMEGGMERIDGAMYRTFEEGNARVLVNTAVAVAVDQVPTTDGDGGFRVLEGTSYTLTTNDLSARDPDDDAAALTWTVTTAPTNGRLALSDALGTAISDFTQAQLEAGGVVYVPTAGGSSDDSFEVRVADDQGARAAPVTVNIAITSLLGNIDLTELTAADGFIIQGDVVFDNAGRSVSGAGDVNGDGFADLIVGARAGDAYVVFGRPGVTNPRVVDLTNLVAGDGFIIPGREGFSVSGAGDINGDGFADLIVGAFESYAGGPLAGEAYVVFGSPDGTNPRVVDLTNLAAGDGFIIQGDAVGDNAGYSVSGAGDVNGDGFADLIVGAPNNVSPSEGERPNNVDEAYVVFGKASGFGSPMSGRQVVDLTGLAAGDGFIIQGDGGGVGDSVSGAGDVNGDGFADLIVGAYRAGEAYVVFGKQDDFGSLDGNRRVIGLESLAAGDGFIIQGDAVGDNAGDSVSGAGDVNGDGYADLIVGARRGDDGGGNAGEAYVLFGKQGGFGSLDTDTNRRVVDLTGLAPADGFIIQGDMAGDYAGVSVSGAGDVNGDGFADLIVGAFRGDDGGTDAGEAYVVFGKASGFGNLDTDTNRRVVDLTGLAPEDGFIIQGDVERDYAGRSVSGAGDVNGDGYADLIVGANRGDDGGTDAGEAYVLFGGPAGLSTEAAAVLGTDGDDVLNADGAATVVLAGAGDDALNIDGFGDTDLLSFDGGSGTDTLRLNGANLSLDLSILADTRLSSIERIDLSGSGANSLTLSRLDLLNLSEVRTQGIDGTEASRAELRVDGNAGDRVTIIGDWMEGSRQEIDDTMYKVFDNGNARLLVNITVDVAGAPPTTDGDGGFRVLEGTSYTLTTNDFSARDPDDDAAALTWTVTTAPTNGRLALSATPDVPISPGMSFTQAQLEAREVVYVPTGGGGSDDGFEVRVADDRGNQADPVTVNIAITSLLGNIDLTELSVADGFIIQGDMGRDRAGYSVSGAGDVNGDGFADLIVGASSGDDGGNNAGEAYVVFGSPGGTHPRVVELTNLGAGDGFIIQGDMPNDNAGNSVSGAGDVNGDGYADLIVGARGGDVAGEAYIVFGKQDGFGSPIGDRQVVDLSGLAPEDGFIIQGDANNDQAGQSVSGAGDVNGDGFADLIVGAYGGDDGGNNAGEAYVVFGSPGGTHPRVVELTNLGAGDGFIIQGDMPNDFAGQSVSGAGDVNGDGYADLIVGARRGADGGITAGEAYIVFGKQDGFGNPIGDRRVVDLTELGSEDGFIIQGDARYDFAGQSVSGAGDVNGDGYADLIVGASYGDDGGDNAGEAYVVFGKQGGFGSLDTDTNRRVVDLTELAPEDGFIIQGDSGNDQAGISVSGAGDINGDGYADLIVGASEGDDGGSYAGEAYVVFGKQDGFGNPIGDRRVVDLTELAPEDGFIIQGDRGGDQAGGSVSAAGDVNGDGYADLIVGAIGADVTRSVDGARRIFGSAGEAYVLFGGPAGLTTETLAGDDVLIDDDDDGVVIAGPGDDVLNIDSFDDTDLLRFDGGTGTDTLSLANPSATTALSLDLSTLADTRLSSIERIDLSGNADNSLTLTRLDLLSLSEVRIDGRAELRVDGNAGDRVTVFGDWMEGSRQEIGGTMYNVFDNGNARLLVNTAVAVAVDEVPTTDGDGRFRVLEGTSYTLTTNDFSARDPDDDAAALTWTVTTAPTNGRLALSTNTSMAISDFTQAQLEAGEVVYVPTAGGGSDDGFEVRVADDQGARAAPVTVNIAITSLLGNIDLTELSAVDGFIIQGDMAGDQAGRSVSGAGDVNGDGFADLIVGARYGDDGGTKAGEAYVVFGNPDGTPPRVVDLTNLGAGDGFIIQGDMAGDQAGRSVSGAGDVNGDGFADLIVGARYGDDGDNNAGEAYVVFGGPEGIPTRVVDLTELAAGDGFIIQGDAPGDLAGYSVSGAGDVNGDGFADLIVGARFGDDGGDFAGEAYVVFGKEGGFGSLDTDTNRRVVDLTELAPADGFIIQGDAERDNAGFSVSGAGDVNGDGFADLIVGALFGDDGGFRAGEAYVLFGKASDFGSPGRRVVDLTSLVPADGFIIQGDMANDFAGFSVSGAGDVNGDGYADLIVGAIGGNDGGTDAGEAYVVFGKEGGFGNLMGGRRVVDLTELAPEDGFIIQGDAVGDQAGGSVSGAGDVNGDGFADLIVGASGGDDGGGSAGEAYVVFGKEGGFGSLDTDTNRRVVDLTELAPEDGFIIQGDVERDNAGFSVSGAGDVNGDGYADLIVGAPGGTDAGEAYVVFGGPAGLSTEAAAVLGTDGEDDLNADGQATVVLAGAGDDVLNIDGFGDTDLLKFDGGSGIDTLRLANTATGLRLNLSALPDTHLSSIERIDISGSGANSLSLTRQDLLNLSEVRTQGIDGTEASRAELLVDGNAGDRVTLFGDWMEGGMERIDGNMYRTFEEGNARLLVNTAVVVAVDQVPTTGGDGGFRVLEGTSYTLTTNDFSARDPDDDAAALTWTVTVAPTNGRLALSTNTSMAIDSFTQAQLEAGEVVYVPTASGGSDDGFIVRVADDQGARAVPVTVNIAITSLLGNIDLSELTAADGFIIQGDAEVDQAGVSVSGAGDVNGDGFADLIIGARYGLDGGTYAGEAYVVFGGPEGIPTRVVDLTELAAGDGFIIQGDAPGDQAGVSVSGAGDVNGDGYADLIVGAFQGDDGGFRAGEAYVVFGKEDDFGSQIGSRRVVDLTNLAPEDGFIIQGDAPDDDAGVSVSGAGDVNGDGYADLIVGAPGGDDGGNEAGEAYVVFGKQDDFGSMMGNRRVVDLESLAAGDGFIIQGDRSFDQAGYSVSGAGDVNGDGYADLIVGANQGDDGGSNAGEAYVVFGSPGGTHPRVVDLTNLGAGDGFIIQGDADGDRAGSVSGAGDVNGDGYADLIVGASEGDDGGDFAGEAYVVFGKEGGFGNLMGGRRVIDLTGLAPDDGFIIQGDAERDRAGISVSGAGDVNGDGYADLIVGAVRGDDGGNRGRRGLRRVRQRGRLW